MKRKLKETPEATNIMAIKMKMRYKKYFYHIFFFVFESTRSDKNI